MDKLYAPWRDQYVMSHIKNNNSSEVCVFCVLFDNKETDEQRYVLYKDADVAILLNLYPYNGGHLLIVPSMHQQHLYELSESIQNKIMKSLSFSTHILKKALGCDAINIGANIGRDAGAGIPEHIHVHVVPRFTGDTGFFTTIGNAKQISVDLARIYQTLKPYFKNINL